MRLFVFDILGLRDDLAGDNSQMLASVVDMVLDIRQQAKAAKDWATSDRIRDGLASVGIRVKDRKDGYDWDPEEFWDRPIKPLPPEACKGFFIGGLSVWRRADFGFGRSGGRNVALLAAVVAAQPAARHFHDQ